MTIVTRSVPLCLLLVFGGVPILARADADKDAAQRMRKIETCIPDAVVVDNAPPVCHTLQERMAAFGVPGVSIAVLHDGAIDWTQGYGVRGPGGKPVDERTLFQAGSISKPVAALAALRLVQEGRLTLDGDINGQLTSWKVPALETGDNKVTLRQLLSHTAGFSVHGFPGYTAGAPVPTLLQVLNGQPPANSPPIRLESAPGSQWKYSGGGYEVMQQLMIDVTRQPFAELVRRMVLKPAGMEHSTYEQPLPRNRQADAATPYAKGQPIEGGAHTYPELAAAGLWTTPADLARFVQIVQRAAQGKDNRVIDQALAQQMLAPGKGHWGLGLEIGGDKAPYFSHGGVNEGFESYLVGYANSGEGVVVMTSAAGGKKLIDEVVRAVAATYGWPDFQPVVRHLAHVDPAVLARYVGTYPMMPGMSIKVTLEDGGLMAQPSGQSKMALFPSSQTRFFFKETADVELEFLPGEQGAFDYLLMHKGGRDLKSGKKTVP